jgi:dipeptidase D
MLTTLQPTELWEHFEAINAVPRPSKKEGRIIEFMLNFGRSLNLETFQDEIGNVIIKKPASLGMENRQTVILQSHLDMVHQKNESTVFDFDIQGIEMFIDGDWVRAKGTTLGADNGIGVAAIMAVLSSSTIIHPAIEALFTIDEETGMTGAKELNGQLLSGTILLNLDTEDDDELSIGCAGGIDTNTSYTYNQEPIRADFSGVKISLRGLVGGHSGMDIDKGRGNANKWMVRYLYHLQSLIEFQLVSFDGGSLRNAIPREATAVIALHRDEMKTVQMELEKMSSILKDEFKHIEPEFQFSFEEIEVRNEKAVTKEETKRVLNALYAIPNGVYRMSPAIPGLVETSSSLAKVEVRNGEFTTQSLQRSSVESSKEDIAHTIKASFEVIGARVIQGGDYPGWSPNNQSPILNQMAGIYREIFSSEPQIKACHAGLECGILLQHLPNVDMISFGPNIRGAHSPDECVQISSVQKFWKFYTETLKRIPEASPSHATA